MFTVRAMTDSTFIDINEGDSFVMRTGEKGQELLIWNKSYEFKKYSRSFNGSFRIK